eukprot:scaffold83358_cov94-Cyclotella_meneghiniana.AAC.1
MDSCARTFGCQHTLCPADNHSAFSSSTSDVISWQDGTSIEQSRQATTLTPPFLMKILSCLLTWRRFGHQLRRTFTDIGESRLHKIYLAEEIKFHGTVLI